MRLRASVSPPGWRSGEGSPSVSFSSAGSSPAARPEGTLSLRGAPRASRQGAALQARWKGLKTLKWSPPVGVTAPGSRIVTPGWAVNSIPASSQAPRRPRSRRRA